MRTSSVGLVILLGVIGVLCFLAFRGKRANKDLAAGLLAMGFSPARCLLEPKEAFVYADMNALQCFEGELRPGERVQLLLATRRGTSSVINGVATVNLEEHVGVLLPAAPNRDDGFRKRIHTDPQARGATPTRVLVTSTSATVINWRCAHSVKEISARLSEVRALVP